MEIAAREWIGAYSAKKQMDWCLFSQKTNGLVLIQPKNKWIGAYETLTNETKVKYVLGFL